jgi:hypothetical protein
MESGLRLDHPPGGHGREGLYDNVLFLGTIALPEEFVGNLAE